MMTDKFLLVKIKGRWITFICVDADMTNGY